MSFHTLVKNHQTAKDNGFGISNMLKTGTLIIPVRVISIVLDKSHPRFNELGEWNGLGAIEYELVEEITKATPYPVAYPLSSNIKNYPLVNEIVYIISLPNDLLGETNVSKRPYYINIVGLWNHPHHNAYPSRANEPNPPQQKDYIQTQVGSAKIITDEAKQIFLGQTFKERTNIHPLLPFEGDLIQEGRWGNSIRLGSTVKGTPNAWSSTGNDGDPIVIIRNGQGTQTDQGWTPVVENIGNDDSSIYLTSTQNIPITASSTSYISYTEQEAPSFPGKYSGQQIILDSGRLVFNTYEDHILLSSAKSINLNSQESVNIDTPKFIVQSTNTYLGSYSANEPLLKGNLTVDVLKNLISALKQLNDTFRNLQTQPIVNLGEPATLDMRMRLESINLNTTLKDIEKQLTDLTSKYNFTI